MEKAKNTYKNSVFLKVVIQKIEKSKKEDFFLQKLPDTISVRKGEKTRIFVHTICFGQRFFWPKTVQTRKNYRSSGFSGNWPKPKMTLFLGKSCSLTWVKKWVLLIVFLKSCVLLKTLFYSVFSKTQLFKNKNCMLKKTEIL